MKYEKSDLAALIRKTVYEVTQIKVDGGKTNLLDTATGIRPADFLYIFDLLEKELHIPAADILIGHSYRIMEVDAMSEALLELLE
ncbi:hypothetical protein IMSAGC012_01131 [Lachnospiraceae bacterium]|nr:hypothetical protein [Eubacterium sp.]MCI9209387.1 hypothetical protein [Eubacterium sp.]GFI26016.1 hypothetical protein IMSAGC012_01131 [Lachnospiraceae bacterium]